MLALACAASATSAHAQNYPAQPVELIVPFAAGGGSEFFARLLSEGLQKRLGQPYVVLNRPGANTNIGTLAVVRAKPDGYTLGIASVGLAANPSLYKRLAFDPQNDLEPITLIANAPTVLVVPPELPVKSLPEFIAYAKSRPGDLNYASYGMGSGPHLATELFQSKTGVKMVHVPYGGGGPAALGAVTNQVQALFSSVLPVLGMIGSGKLKPIAIASARRSELLPDVPTFAESGLDYRTGTWFGLLAPAKTPPAIIDLLHNWFGLLAPAKTPPAIIDLLHKTSVAVLQDPGLRTKVAEQGAEVVANSPAEFRAFIKEETERLAGVIRGAGIQLD